MAQPVKDSIPTLRWGIIGRFIPRISNTVLQTNVVIATGWIASAFVSDLLLDPEAHRDKNAVKHVIQAIGSSSTSKAKGFWSKLSPNSNISEPSFYDSYSQVYDDPNVAIVYIATPHSMHLENTLDAINAGKHVLCEKPMTINARDTEKLITAAKSKGVFLMEGR